MEAGAEVLCAGWERNDGQAENSRQSERGCRKNGGGVGWVGGVGGDWFEDDVEERGQAGDGLRRRRRGLGGLATGEKS